MTRPGEGVRISKRTREQIVELLRCAADDAPGDLGIVGMFGAADALGWPSSSIVDRVAWKIRCEAYTDTARFLGSALGKEAYRHAILEAAARVVEGWTP